MYNILTGDNTIILRDRNIFPESSVKLVVTSPPYGNLRTYASEINVELLSSLLAPIVVPGGVVVWVVGDVCKNGAKQMLPFRHAIDFTKSGAFFLHDTIIFEKHAAAYPASRSKSARYTQIYEYMHIFVKCGKGVSKPVTFNMHCDKPNITKRTRVCTERKRANSDVLTTRAKRCPPPPKFSPRTNIWKYTVGGLSSLVSSKIHPAVFPYALALDHILCWSNPDDVVLDIFSGSGTTVLAAVNSGRKGIGIEISEVYAKASIDIIKQHASSSSSPI